MWGEREMRMIAYLAEAKFRLSFLFYFSGFTLNQIEENVPCLPEDETGICALEFLSYVLFIARHEQMPFRYLKKL